MFTAIQKCWELLPRNYRWGLFGLFTLMNLNALSQLVMVGSILPFLQAISDAGRLEGGRAMQLLHRIWEPPDHTSLLIALGALVIGAVVLANLIGALHSILAARFSAKLNTCLSTLLLRSYLLRPYTYYLNRNTSEFLRNIFSEVYLVTGGFIGTVMNGITRLLTITGLSLLLIVVSPWIALGAGFFFAASYTGIYFLLRRKLSEAGKKRAECDNLRYKAVSEAFGTLKELKVLRREDYFVRAFEEPSQRYFRHQERAALYSSLPKHVVETLAFAGMIGVALILLHQHDGVAGALPVLGVFGVAGYRLLPAIQGFYSCFSRLRYYRESVDKVYSECAPLLTGGSTPALQWAQGGSESGRSVRLPLKRELELRAVTYSYPKSERPAVHEVNLTLPARSRIGLCGKSGAGKTTLADILLGLLEPQAGEMRVDGIPVDETNRSDWQRNCGYVPQEIYLADDSVRRNIAYGIAPETIDEARIRDAARLANIDTFIETELPAGYDTEVGERGIRLSGGQRQRIGIARALYHDPDVIVLDEATSSVDTETERVIVEAVESLAGRKTIIMIAHRLSTIRRCDRIVLVEDSRIAATGTFDELATDNSHFRRMAEA